MTKNQIDYQKLEEERYHNRMVEQETARTNKANEEIKAQSNVINAAHYSTMDAETSRSNRAHEAETMRHNQQAEQIDWFNAKSNDALRKSNVVLNAAYTDASVAEAALTRQKTKTEEQQTEVTKAKKEQVLKETLNTVASTKLLKQELETEKNRTTLVYGQAGLTALDVATYNNNRLINALSLAGNSATSAAKVLAQSSMSKNFNSTARKFNGATNYPLTLK